MLRAVPQHLYFNHFAHSTFHFPLSTFNFQLSTLHFPLCTFHFSHSTLHFAHSTFKFPLCTLHFSLFTLHIPHSTFHFSLSTFNFPLFTLCIQTRARSLSFLCSHFARVSLLMFVYSATAANIYKQTRVLFLFFFRISSFLHSASFIPFPRCFPQLGNANASPSSVCL